MLRMEKTKILGLLLVLSSFHGAQSQSPDALPVDPYQISTFSATPTNTTLNHFVVSEDGSIYIGGVDVLYHVSPDLEVLSQMNIAGDVPNINKILGIVPGPVNKLITCGSGLNQTCQLRNLSSLVKEGEILFVGPEKNRLVAPGSETTVGLVVRNSTTADTSVKVALHVAQSMPLDERLARRPISVKCLIMGNDQDCIQSDRLDKRTDALRSAGLPAEFIVKYAAMFEYRGYIYFLASQLEGPAADDNIVAKLSRICQNETDTDLSGLTELTLDCRGDDNTMYSIARAADVLDGKLYTVFVKNDPGEDGGFAEFRPSNQSALCVYDMEVLVAEFDAAITNCTCGDDQQYRSRNNWLGGSLCTESLSCSRVKTLPCMTLKGFAKYPERDTAGLGGLPGKVIFEQPGATFSSLLVTHLNQPFEQYIGIIGTREGFLLKLHFDNSSSFLYEELELSSPVLSDTQLSDDKETITVLTEIQIMKLSVANCSQFLTCDECIRPGTGRGDPYCGWCTLEKRCTRYHECSDSDVLDRWLYYDEDVCVQISTAKPASLPVDGDQNVVTLTIHHLPMNREFNYSCHFGDFMSQARRTSSSQLTCLSPNQTQVPPIAGGENSVAVNLSVSASGFDVKFVTTTFHFFNCNVITSCGSCVTEWDCDWCIDDLKCVHERQDSCLNISSSSLDALNTCPQLSMAETIYVPAGVEMTIAVTARNLNLTGGLDITEYRCVLEDEAGMQYDIEASITSGEKTEEFNVTCQPMRYSYQEIVQDKMLNLTLEWSGTEIFLDGSVNVMLYKCGVDRPDCSRCLSNLTTDPGLLCRWCMAITPASCVYGSACSNVQDECDAKPIITSVYPPNGPVEGGTIVQINGTDLGQRFEDIGRIQLAGIDCDHRMYRDMYRVGASVTCESGPAKEKRSGMVSVTLRSQAFGDALGLFSYNDPVIGSIFPVVGPMSGGTAVNINGTDLQTGRDILVMLGGGTCIITSISPDLITCTNVAHNDSTMNTTELTVSFDEHPRVAEDTFTFLPDPTVTDLNPLRAIRSGGNLITAEGTGFDIIQRPKIVFTVSDEEPVIEDCQAITQEEMVCRSPRLDAIRAKRADDGVVAAVTVGFIMDGVTRLLDWSVDNGETFIVVPDPTYEEYPDGVDYDPRLGRLKLNGTNLNLGSQAGDVTVYIGDESCTNVVISATDVTCSPPPESPPAGDIYGGGTERGLPFIIVQHANLDFDIGYVEYISPGTTNVLLIALSAIAVLMAVALCILLFIWRTRRQKAKKINDLELQVREIQDSVSGNLKSLFATLQTTAENFEAVLSEMRTIPLLSRRQYLLNMLFLGLGTEPSTEPTEEVLGNPHIKTAMEKFSTSLLLKKNFLEVLVRALDQDPTIGSMEKVNIASLLSVCLLQDGKQELLTTVITGLMREQVEDCDGRAQKCRILFSRSETILEKLLSNWVTVFQYQYLKDHAAMPLHRLFHAIKYVCEMGPIDAVTGQSQFSINDQQMLQMQINFNELSLSVIVNSVTGETATISALDVNTVTQVKQRIISYLYKDSPFSEQPDPYMYDLMWRTGKGGQLILRDDDDLPGNTENEWRKLNTMGDFSVTSDLATFELVERQENPNTTLTVQQNNPGEPAGQAQAASATGGSRRYEAVASKHTSFNPAAFPSGTRPWHLVKEEDVGDDDGTQNKQREIKEVVLPFLPATRKYIQKYVDSFLSVVFADQSDDISPAIKYLFQFFDREADKLDKPEFAKAWKDNVLTLRYWTTILANPQYALDLGIHSYTSASLRTLVQVVRDTCAGRSKPIKTHFSPSRLLYSSFIPGYISKLANFYLHVRDLGRVTLEDMVRECQRVEQDFDGSFDPVSTQYELYKILDTHKELLMRALEDDDVCQEADMASKLEAIREQIAGE